MTALHVTNTFNEPIKFHALLHNYLWVDDVRNKGALVFGLNGVNYFDKVAKNPWVECAKNMSDFGDEEYKNMVAIEPGRVSERQSLSAGNAYTLQQTISVLTTTRNFPS
ncbi:unnamed protein product [Peronospora destructor]|uniref:Uncharacterized protein n=1 Tax=Peronospora destructor TaxID=86335 RepID=A0AAV0TVN3_9STRA|nr:unnamed protein product [Peronospora destructor]